MEITTENDIIIWANQVIRPKNNPFQRGRVRHFGNILEVWVKIARTGNFERTAQIINPVRSDPSSRIIFKKTYTLPY